MKLQLKLEPPRSPHSISAELHLLTLWQAAGAKLGKIMLNLGASFFLKTYTQRVGSRRYCSVGQTALRVTAPVQVFRRVNLNERNMNKSYSSCGRSADFWFEQHRPSNLALHGLAMTAKLLISIAQQPRLGGFMLSRLCCRMLHSIPNI